MCIKRSCYVNALFMLEYVNAYTDLLLSRSIDDNPMDCKCSLSYVCPLACFVIHLCLARVITSVSESGLPLCSESLYWGFTHYIHIRFCSVVVPRSLVPTFGDANAPVDSGHPLSVPF